MKAPEKSSAWKRHKKKIIAGALLATATVGNKIDSTMTDKDLREVAAPTDTERSFTLPEAPFTPEHLRPEYEKIAIRRDIYEGIAGTRHQIRKLAGFLLRALPGIVKTKLSSREDISYSDLENAGIQKESMAALVDLGAFDLQRLRAGDLDFSFLAKNGKEVILMEDRDPMFYLNYEGYQEEAVVPLNRHGNKKDQWTMADMKKLVDGLHAAGIKVVIGFWGNTGNKDGNPFIKRNWQALKPVFPTSDDINPLSFVKDAEGNEMPCADYIVKQYGKLNRDFGFDGLFLGDGLMGFRAFLDFDGPYQAADFRHLWTDFYKRINKGVKSADANDMLWAYDCMANGTARARTNGLDLEGVAPFIDNYIFQSYSNDAWGGGYMNLPGYNLERDRAEIASLPPALKAKTRYSVGLGDSVEGWYGKKQAIRDKHGAMRDHAGKGTLGVWSNELIRGIL